MVELRTQPEGSDMTDPLRKAIEQELRTASLVVICDNVEHDETCPLECRLVGMLSRCLARWEQQEAAPAQAECLNPVSQVYFRAGLIACREYMARFVEAQDPSIAASIRANWWPSLGLDLGPPRKLAFSELTSGEYGTPEFRCLTADDVSPTLEALPVALGFLEQP